MTTDEEIRAHVEQEVQDQVVARLSGGQTAAQVRDALIADGFDPDAAAGYVDAVVSTAEAQRFRLGSLIPAIAGGLVAAIAGGTVWGAITYLTGYEVGFLAVGVGAIAGLGVLVAVRGRRGMALQAVAVFSALAGIVFGKYVAIVQLIQDALAKEIGQEMADGFGLFDPRSFLLVAEGIGEVVSPYDLLWVGLAAWTAWRIPAGLSLRMGRRPVRDEAMDQPVTR